MEKLGVELDQEKVKTAEKTGVMRCPKCGTELPNGKKAWCSNCGTEPFEKRPEKDGV